MTKTPEEKAREYANRPNAVTRSEELAYIVAYHSRDEEVKAYRKALKEIAKQVPRCNFNLSTSTSYSEANRLDELIVKAKQLIEEE